MLAFVPAPQAAWLLQIVAALTELPSVRIASPLSVSCGYRGSWERPTSASAEPSASAPPGYKADPGECAFCAHRSEFQRERREQI